MSIETGQEHAPAGVGVRVDVTDHLTVRTGTYGGYVRLTNGSTVADVAAELTTPDGRSVGDALLTPSGRLRNDVAAYLVEEERRVHAGDAVGAGDMLRFESRR